MVLRDRDTNGGGGWTGASDGTLNARHYYAQNWRADVSGVFDNSGAVLEWQKYSAYGIPYLLTPGDHDKNGLIDAADQTAYNTDYGAGNLRADVNEDGTVDGKDQSLFNTSYTKATPGGRYKLSASDIGNRKGYAGYEHEGFGNDLAAPALAHVRNRVLHFGLGRWTRRDPLGYVDGASLCSYVSGQSVTAVDSLGLCAATSCDVRTSSCSIEWIVFEAVETNGPQCPGVERAKQAAESDMLRKHCPAGINSVIDSCARSTYCYCWIIRDPSEMGPPSPGCVEHDVEDGLGDERCGYRARFKVTACSYIESGVCQSSLASTPEIPIKDGGLTIVLQ